MSVLRCVGVFVGVFRLTAACTVGLLGAAELGIVVVVMVSAWTHVYVYAAYASFLSAYVSVA